MLGKKNGARKSATDASPRDERFFTPRAQATSSRSDCSADFGTPRSSREDALSSRRSSSSETSEYATPRHHGPQESYFAKQQYMDYHQSQQQQQQQQHVLQQQRSGGSYHHHHHQQQYQQQRNDHSRPPLPQHQTFLETTSATGSRDVEDIFSLARHSRFDAVNNLLSRGVPVDIRDENGNTILSIACQNGNKRIVKLALRYGADVNAVNQRGNTAMHFCHRYGFGATLGAYLISKGADASIRNKAGMTCAEESSQP